MRMLDPRNVLVKYDYLVPCMDQKVCMWLGTDLKQYGPDQRIQGHNIKIIQYMFTLSAMHFKEISQKLGIHFLSILTNENRRVQKDPKV